MQILIDAVKYQRANGLNTNRHIIRKIKNDEEALKEATELVRAIISECIERNLPIDDALAALHFATIQKTEVDYAALLAKHRNEDTSRLRQARAASNTGFLKQIEDVHNEKVLKLKEQMEKQMEKKGKKQ